MAAIALVLVAAAFAAAYTTPKQRFARGLQLEREGKYAEALSVYRDLRDRIPPNQLDALSKTESHIGECLWHLQKPEDAFAAFQRAILADSWNAKARERLGELYLASGDLDQATDQAATLLKADPDNVEALSLLGTVDLERGDSAHAKEYFTRVLKIDPRQTDVAVALADVYNREQRPDTAREVLREAGAAAPHEASPWLALGRLEEIAGSPAEAEEAYRHAVAADNSPETNLRLAQFLQRASRMGEAEQVLHRVDAMRPNHPTSEADFQLTAGRVVEAVQHYLSELDSRARVGSQHAQPETTLNQSGMLASRLIEAELETAHSGDPADATSAVERARMHLNRFRSGMDAATIAILEAEIALTQGDWNTAMFHATTALDLAPQSAAARYTMGVVKYRMGDVATATALWQSAVEADPNFVPALLALARRGLDTGDYKPAEEEVSSVVRQEPANLQALVLYARILAGEKDYRSAFEIAQRAMAADPSGAEPRVVLGEIALDQGAIGEALVQFEQAVMLESRSAAAIDGLTRVYRHGRISREILQRMEKVADAAPPSPTLMEIVGRLYADRGWNADAERCLKRAVEMDGGRASASGALTRLYAASGRMRDASASLASEGGGSAALLAGVQAQDRQDLASAIREYEYAVRHGDRSGVAANNLAWIYAEQGSHLDRALDLANTARSLSPRNPAVLDTLGSVYLKRREYSDAVKSFQAAVELAQRQHDSRPVYRQHLAEAYLRVGRPDAARQELAKLSRPAADVASR